MFKRKDVKACRVCGEGMASGGPMFYRIHTETLVLDSAAIQRQSGLEQMMGGNATIAQVMGPDEDLANTMNESTVLVCLSCMMARELACLIEEDPADGN